MSLGNKKMWKSRYIYLINAAWMKKKKNSFPKQDRRGRGIINGALHGVVSLM